MSTRGLICVAHGRKYHLAQHISEDAYPSEAGAHLLAFLGQNPMQVLSLLMARLAAVHECSARELVRRMKACGFSHVNGATKAQIRTFESKWPHLTSSPGVKILDHVLCGTADTIQLHYEFARSSLYCQWAYVVELEKQALEVYTGPNTTPLSPRERFFFKGHCEEGYYPVRLVKQYALSALPSKEQFCVDLPDC